MVSANTGIVKNSLILYVKLVLTSIIGLITSRIVLRSLGASDFGLYSVVGGIVVMLNVFGTAMTNASYRFIAFEVGRGSVAAVNKVFNISLALHICMALIVVLFAEPIGRYYINNYLNVPVDKVGDAIFVFRLSVLAVVFSVFSIPFQAVLIAHERFVVQASIEVMSSFLKIGAVVFLVYYLGNKLRCYSVLTCLLVVITAMLYVFCCRREYLGNVCWNFQGDKTKYLEMIGFSGWMMIGVCASMAAVQGAALVINVFFGTVVNASFGIASQLNSFVIMFSRNIGQAAVPQITKSYSGGHSDRTLQIVCYISKYSFFMMLLPALPILLEAEFLLKLWLGEVPQYTSVFCRLMILNALAGCLGTAIPAAVHATGRIKYFQIILSTTSLLSLPVAYVLFMYGCPSYSVMVVFIGTELVNVVVCQVLLRSLIQFDVKTFLKRSYLKIFYVGVSVSPLFVLRNLYHDGILRFVLLSAVAVIWLLAAVYVVGMESFERDLVRCRIGKLYCRMVNGVCT
ncbi:MAG: lipopolysaccharide biosynthesis protein [Pirellulaceae bacterium]